MGSNIFQVPRYKLVRADRIASRSGGIALYIHESVQFTVIDQFQQSHVHVYKPEFLFVLLHVGSVKILLGLTYCAPKATSKGKFWHDVEDALASIDKPSDHTILMGDFNINWQINGFKRFTLANFLHAFNLKRIPFGPTHHRGDSHTTIDYICVSDLKNVISFNQHHNSGISEDDVLFATFSFVVPLPVTRVITRRSFRDFDSELFHRDLASINWERIVHINDINDKVEFFSTAINQLYDRHAPLRTFTPKAHSFPWLNPDIRSLIKKRNKAWRTFRRTRRSADHIVYKSLRKQVKTATRNARSAYYHSKFMNAKSSTDLWKHVGELGLANRAHATFTLPTDIDTLNHYFAGDSNPRPLRDCRPSARISPDERFFFQHVSEVEALEAILSARSNTCGPDYIPCSFLKECLPTILPPLLNIFDSSLQSGVFPTAWKRAFVRPLPKINPPRESSHLRPISILCASSKILEAVVHKQISRYVADEDLLDPLQSGFRKRHSTTLVSIVEDIREAIDNKQVVLAVAIDHTRAFDCVNVPLLVDKLVPLGFSDSACNWVRSFLTDRSQVVVAPSGEIRHQLRATQVYRRAA